MAHEVSRIEESIDVEVPVSTAYDQWTQFEAFPQFMEGVEAVEQIDDTHLHWRAKLGGLAVEWDAEISEQIPNRKIAWRSTSGARNAGTVRFDRLSDRRTRATLEVEYDPKGALQNLGDALGVVKRRVQGDLERFKDFIERRGVETGAWRGRVPHS